MTLLVRYVFILALVACGGGDGGDRAPDARNPPPIDASVAPGFGEKCTCSGTSGGNGSKFECSGTNICASGLSCIGQTFGGVSQGTCRGPTCCSGSADCAAALGKQSTCGANQKCVCPFGDLECVGTACTCASGVPATRGLCYPK